jgi:low affinity Fe/Cu permease
MNSTSWFARFAKSTSRAAGRPATFAIAVGVIVVWAVTGPMFNYSDTWQLMINTGTTIITFLMVFLIQHTQNRDSEAVQVKLDELIRVTEGAHNALLDLEDADDEQLEKIRSAYAGLAEQARDERKAGKPDTDQPEVREENGEKKSSKSDAGDSPRKQRLQHEDR